MKAVLELLPIGRPALAESWIVRRDDVIAARECRDEVPKHPRRCGETVQQYHDGRGRGARFSIEDVYAVDLRCSVVGYACRTTRDSGLCAGRGG